MDLPIRRGTLSGQMLEAKNIDLIYFFFTCTVYTYDKFLNTISKLSPKKWNATKSSPTPRHT